MRSYDNRPRGLARLVTSLDMRELLPKRFVNKRGRPGRSHYRIRIGDKNIAYCYIRKNASSSFKRFFAEQSDWRSMEEAHDGTLRFMNKYHRVRDVSCLERCEHTIFVCRDPADRLVSAFTNKFIVKSNNQDIFESYYRFTGKNPERATFREFVMEYLRKNLFDLDPHVLSQSHHLLPIKYTNAILLDDLCEAMRDIIGPTTAREYFGERVNESSSRAAVGLPNAVDLTAAELEEVLRDRGGTPRSEDFLTDEIFRVVRKLYKNDYAIHRHISESKAARRA